MSSKTRTIKWLAAAAVLPIVLAACSSNSSSSTTTTSGSSSGSGGSKGTYTIGVLTDLTGPAASGNKTCPQGVQAGVELAKRAGYNIKYVVADTNTSPSGALTGAQQLVAQDHVFAVVGCSALFFGAAPYLTSQGIPVVGIAQDGPEWITSKNMFSVVGPIDTTKVATTPGEFFKMAGATNVGSLGYSVAPASAESALAAGVSAQAAGLKAGYVNANFPFGSTNVEPVALAMKSAGVDGVSPSTDPNTGFALITALRQAGATPKVALLATGYGGDLEQAGANASEEAQGVYFLSSWEPVEMHTAATQQFQSDLKAVGIDHDPTYAEYVGYSSLALLTDGLNAAGSSPTMGGLITAFNGLHQFNSAGLFGTRSINMSQRTNVAIGVDNCYWITKYSGSAFQLVANADPICGTIIPGKSVHASS